MNSTIIIIKRIKTNMDDLTAISELGSGTCGQVYKMVHNPTGYVMAVKVIKNSTLFAEMGNRDQVIAIK